MAKMRSIGRTLHDCRKDVCRGEFVNPCPVEWMPIPNRCHDNAEAWVKRFPSWAIVRGWLLISEDEVLGTIFDAHSVVRAPGGRLWDITQDQEHRFLVHPGDDVQFMTRVRAGPWVRLIYIPEF